MHSKILVALIVVLVAAPQTADASATLLPRLPESRVRHAGDPSCQGCDVLVVSLDTLRPDHLGCYGYDRPTSPRLDGFCRDAVRFDAAFTPAPSTLPAHASLFTSLLPRQHGASFSQERGLSDEAMTLAEILRGAGYRTAAFVDGGQIGPDWGLDQGFDVYSSDYRDRFEDTVDRALEWLDGDSTGAHEPSANRDSGPRSDPSRNHDPPAERRPFFLFLHTYQIHHPYEPSPEDLALVEHDYSGPLGDRIAGPELQEINDGSMAVDGDDRAHIVALYDAEIRAVDRAFGRLIDALKRRDLYDSTTILVISDHGEELGEHGKIGLHSHSLYNELLRVVWLAKLPRSAYRRSVVQEPVSLLDLYPTVLDVVDRPPFPPGLMGRSILGLLEGPDASRPGRKPEGDNSRHGQGRDGGEPTPWPRAIVSEQEYGGALTAIQTRRWKLYRDRLFSLVLDPGESVDLSGRYAGVARMLEVRLERAGAGSSLESVPVEADEETLEELRALGYVR